MASTVIRLGRLAPHVLLLVGLPVFVLIVPQGTVARSMIPEALFAGYLLATAAITLVVCTGRIPLRYVHPLLYAFLVYFLVINPVWSLLAGNDVGRVVVTTLPFTILSLFYVFSLASLDSSHVVLLVKAVVASSVILALVVIANFFLGDTSLSASRSTGIEGSRTLTLPLLPLGAVILTCRALGARQPRSARLNGAGAMLVLLAILMTVTRAMLLAYLVGTVFATGLLVRNAAPSLRRSIVARCAVGLALALVVAAPMMTQWVSRISPDSEADLGTILGRVDEYMAFWQAFLQSPALGKGLGYLVTYPSEFDWTLRDSGITVCHSHLFFLAGTTGVVGLLFYYSLLGGAFFSVCRKVRYFGNNPERLSLLAGIAGALVAGVAFTLTSTTFTTLSYNLFLAVFLFASRIAWESE